MASREKHSNLNLNCRLNQAGQQGIKNSCFLFNQLSCKKQIKGRAMCKPVVGPSATQKRGGYDPIRVLWVAGIHRTLRFCCKVEAFRICRISAR